MAAPAKKKADPYDEPNPELGSAREAAEAAATPPAQSATPKATDAPTTDPKE